MFRSFHRDIGHVIRRAAYAVKDSPSFGLSLCRLTRHAAVVSGQSYLEINISLKLLHVIPGKDTCDNQADAEPLKALLSTIISAAPCSGLFSMHILAVFIHERASIAAFSGSNLGSVMPLLSVGVFIACISAKKFWFCCSKSARHLLSLSLSFRIVSCGGANGANPTSDVEARTSSVVVLSSAGGSIILFYTKHSNSQGCSCTGASNY